MNELFIYAAKIPMALDMLILGVILAILWLLTCLGGELWCGVYRWIHDGEKTLRQNPILKMLSGIFGWTPLTRDESAFHYKKGARRADGEVILMPMLGIMSATPLAVYLSFLFYPVVLFAGVLLLVLHLMRASVRHKKVLADHMNNKDAHK